jgi:hypothetical protein
MPATQGKLPNFEYALLLKGRGASQRIIMAVKHPCLATADQRIDILLCGSRSDARKEDAVELWGFVLPADHSGINFGDYTFGRFDPGAVETACCNAELWRHWKPLFEKVVAKEMLRPRQMAVARKFFDRPFPVQEIIDRLVEDGKIYVDRYDESGRPVYVHTDFQPRHTTKL